MDHIMDYGDVIDTANGADRDSTERSEGSPLSAVNPFRTKSLLLATFPWFTALPMAPSRLVENIGDFPETRDTFVCHFLN
jgi:hypothetical protein